METSSISRSSSSRNASGAGGCSSWFWGGAGSTSLAPPRVRGGCGAVSVACDMSRLLRQDADTPDRAASLLHERGCSVASPGGPIPRERGPNLSRQAPGNSVRTSSCAAANSRWSRGSARTCRPDDSRVSSACSCVTSHSHQVLHGMLSASKESANGIPHPSARARVRQKRHASSVSTALPSQRVAVRASWTCMRSAEIGEPRTSSA